MKKIYFELCAETLEAAVAAEEGGADRVEICSELRIGGVTPEDSLVRAAMKAVTLPIHVLVRPRGGDFVYGQEEFASMLESVERVKRFGVQGVVIGALTPDGTVDVRRMRSVVDAARPMRVTFHRAFDECSDLSEALEDVILAGADSLLTSGGAADVQAGARAIAKLTRQAAGRIEVIAGGGLRLDSLADLVRKTGVHWVHGSLLRGAEKPESAQGREVHSAVREAMTILQQLQRAS